MVLECSNLLFLFIVLIHVWWDGLDLNFISKYCLTIVGNSLLIIFIFGFIPLFLKLVWSFVVAVNCSVAYLLFNDSASILMELLSYNIMMYLCPLHDTNRNIPVLSQL